MTLTEAQIARVQLLEDAEGRLTASAVLADATDPTSPLHPLIEWDRDKAATAHQLDCAREIIRTVKITVTTTTTVLRAPAYVRDPDAVGQGYRSVVALRADPATALEALKSEVGRASGVMLRARHVAVVLGLTDEIDVVLTRLSGLQLRLDGDGASPPSQSVS